MVKAEAPNQFTDLVGYAPHRLHVQSLLAGYDWPCTKLMLQQVGIQQ